VTSRIETVYASSEPQLTVAEALQQMKGRLDSIIEQSVNNVEASAVASTLWSFDSCGHTVTSLMQMTEKGDFELHFVAATVLLITYSGQPQ
jgi:S-adenosylmethionine/arginine decarboxylase-like enzyme